MNSLLFQPEEQNEAYPEGTPTIKQLSAWLATLEVDDHHRSEGSDVPSIDVRIRVYEGDWYGTTGDFQDEQDHRGHWGNCILFKDTDNRDWLARWMLEQVANSYTEELAS